MYADSENKDFGGWIVINKSTGEWCITETPLNIDEYKEKYVVAAKDNFNSIKKNKKFKRCFTDVDEYFRILREMSTTLWVDFLRERL